jgi:hypothetical protein
MDRPGDPPVRTVTAAGVVLAGYLLFFGIGILGAIDVARTGRVLDPMDYGTFSGGLDVGIRLIKISGAVLILMLICRRLQIPLELAGIPHHPASPIPTLATIAVAVTGTVAANLLLTALHGPNPDPNVAAGGVIGNPWAMLSVVPDLSAGVVEEIIIVAVPVLIGRRAGWHPVVIIAVSMLMRWPFHVYHGVWSSLPWAMLWGGANVVAFLYLRRLVPLIVFHAGYDLQSDLQSAYGDIGGTTVLITGAALVIGLLLRVGVRRLRRPNPTRPTGDAAIDPVRPTSP